MANVAQEDDGTLYAAVPAVLDGSVRVSMYRSSDMGATWTHVEDWTPPPNRRTRRWLKRRKA